MLKQARQRFAARVPAIDGSGTPVFKVFPLQNLASRLRCRKYAFREFANLREAQRRGIPVPAPFAYFEKRRLGFVVANGPVIEDLAGWHDLRQFGGTLSAATMACEPLAELWRRGCLHIDARDENTLYAPEGHEYRIIDWQ